MNDQTPQTQKILVVFYSLNGNTRYIAQAIAGAVGADMLELKPRKDIPAKGFWRFLWGGKQAMMKAHPDLHHFPNHPEEYDVLFIGTPVWAGTVAPALNTFFLKVPLKDKKIALFCCSGGIEGKAFQRMREALHNNIIVSEIGFRDPLKYGRDTAFQEAQQWARRVLEVQGI